MYNAFKSLRRFKLLTILIVIQLALGISLLDNVAMQLMGEVNKSSVYTKMFNIDNTYMLRIRDDIDKEHGPGDDREEISKNICNDIYELKKNRKVKDIFSCYNHIQVIKELKEKSQRKEDNNSFGLEKYFITLEIDKNFFEHYKLSIDEGSTFNDGDFNLSTYTDVIPIIVGSDYKENVKVGDEFTQRYTSWRGDDRDIKYKVIGILNENSIVTFLARNEFFNAVTYSNSVVISPTKDTFPVSMAMWDIGIFIETDHVNNIEKVSEEIDKIIKENDPTNKYGFEKKIISLKKDMGAINLTLENDINIAILLGVILSILAIIGISTIILGELKHRKTEFGIRLAAGASIRDIAKEVVYKVIILSTLSVVVSFFYVGFTTGEYTVGIKLWLFNIGLIVLFTLLISIIPILTLKKFNVVELLKENVK